jgi:protein-tyrosine kinase
MKQDTPMPANGSLIERAAEVYDFGSLFRDAPMAPAQPVAPVQPVSAPIAQPHYAPPHAIPVGSPAHAVASTVPTYAEPLVANAPAMAPPIARQSVGARSAAFINLDQLRDGGFIEPGAAPTTLSEEFRLIKRQILLSAFGGRNAPGVDRGRVVMVCSSQPNDGKTFCSINLALSMASERDVEVVLVDADVAKPEILSTLGVEGGPGLLDAIANPALDTEDLIIRTSLPTVSILPTGRRSHDDTELLASARTQAVIEGLLASHPRRLIIIDTAPALVASPASVLAHHVGQVVMVVRADKTGENELREAVGLLEGCEHIQLLLNGATYAGANQKFGSYYGYGG